MTVLFWMLVGGMALVAFYHGLHLMLDEWSRPILCESCRRAPAQHTVRLAGHSFRVCRDCHA